MEYQLVSANAYVIEPPDLFQSRLPDRLSDRAPRMETAADGSSEWIIQGLAPVPLSRIAMRGSDWDTRRDPRRPATFAEMLPAYYDSRERLKAQRLDSVDAEVLYGYPYLWSAINQSADRE